MRPGGESTALAALPGASTGGKEGSGQAKIAGIHAHFGIQVKHVSQSVKRNRRTPGLPLERGLDDARDPGIRQAALQEAGHGHFVGGIQGTQAAWPERSAA